MEMEMDTETDVQRAASRPPDYVSHRPESVRLPSVPQHPPLQPRGHVDITLPDLKTVLSPDFHPATSPTSFIPASPATSTRSVQRIDRYGYSHNNGARKSAESAINSPTEINGFRSGDSVARKTASVLSAEDADIRDAAEALAELGKSGKRWPSRIYTRRRSTNRP